MLEMNPMRTTQFQKAIFALDAFEGEQFEGYTTGETWNGFACPYLTFESAQRLMAVLSAEGQIAFYDAADQFVCAKEDSKDDPDRYSAADVEGRRIVTSLKARIYN